MRFREVIREEFQTKQNPENTNPFLFQSCLQNYCETFPFHFAQTPCQKHHQSHGPSLTTQEMKPLETPSKTWMCSTLALECLTTLYISLPFILPIPEEPKRSILFIPPKFSIPRTEKIMINPKRTNQKQMERLGMNIWSFYDEPESFIYDYFTAISPFVMKPKILLQFFFSPQ